MQKPFKIDEMKSMAIEDEFRQFAPKPKQLRLPILAEREATHGNFHDNASFAQTLKSCFRLMPRWENLEPAHKEVIDLMCTKFARIMVGDPMFEDHWRDLHGYAELGREICKD